MVAKILYKIFDSHFHAKTAAFQLQVSRRESGVTGRTNGSLTDLRNMASVRTQDPS